VEHLNEFNDPRTFYLTELAVHGEYLTSQGRNMAVQGRWLDKVDPTEYYENIKLPDKLNEYSFRGGGEDNGK